MIFKRITVPLLCLLPLLAVMALLATLHTPITNAAPNGVQTVTTLADSGAGSLRQAIADATAGDTIDFNVSGTIVLATELVIDKNLTINGGNSITVSGNNVTRVFKVANGTVIFDSLTIANGRDFQTHDCWGDACGGGMLIQSGNVSVMLINSTLSDNSAHIYGGGIANLSVLTITNSTLSNNAGTNGGGLYNYGTVMINDTAILSNSVSYYGGGIYHHHGMITVNNGNISGNSADSSSGAIYNYYEMVLNNTTISHNSSDGHGGGIVNSGQSPNPGVLIINDSRITDNSASYGGGIVNFADVTISNGTISYNSALFYGGGISVNYGNATIQNSSVYSNSVSNGDGGGVHNDEDATITLKNSTISDNFASEQGGGIYSSGLITISSNTVTDNRADMAAGGISSYGNVAARTIITNSIISGNMISTTTASDLALHTTEIDSYVSGGHNLIGSIGTGVSVFLDGVNGDQTAVNNPKIEPLADNGGSTLTHALQPDSPALDTGANCGATDQRGITRPQGAACDIGAYEYEAPIIYTDFVFLPVVMK